MNLKCLYRFLYTLAISVYVGAIYMVAPFHRKAKLMIEGRKRVLDRLRAVRRDGDRWIWVHVSSLGEFEQARPLLERLHSDYPYYRVALTFFSPSGYEPRKNYPLVDIVTYLPFDTSRDIVRFIDTLQPEIVLFVKYEFWLRTLSLLRKRRITTYLISAIFRQEQPFFKKGYGAIFRDALRAFKTIFVQNKESVELLHSIDFDNAIVTGDTRIDRVAMIRDDAFSLPALEALSKVVKQKGSKIIILGSSWPQDEEMLIPYLLSHPKVFPIVVPHEVDESHIRAIISIADGQATRFSEWAGKGLEQMKMLIIDKVGLLSKLYRFADIAYIGGGFGKGIHNTLEPAVYGIPVLFGPNYHKFREAVELIKVGGGFTVSSLSEATSIIDKLLSDDTYLVNSGQAAHQWIEEQLGATDGLLSEIFCH